MNRLARLEKVQAMVRTCLQCGTCTGTCPNVFGMDYTPRQLWRLVLDGDLDGVFESRTFVLCSSCYHCTLRCPRGLPLTEAMAELKQTAAALDLPVVRNSARFYRSFLASVRRHGRVNETEFMTRYFVVMMNPVLPLKYTPLGLRLMARRKVPVLPPLTGRSGVLGPLFDRVRELEGDS
ncbi:MAG: 4Fe-4S dicluster domain-containing protein [Thermodesulfobacteriota bacterium]